jgi:hypothetical protein
MHIGVSRETGTETKGKAEQSELLLYFVSQGPGAIQDGGNRFQIWASLHPRVSLRS